MFDPKERPSDSRCIPRKGARQPGIESHLHYSYECGKGVVQPASCMPGLEEWVHSRQYREPSSPLWLGKALSWLITVRLISVKHNMKRISNQRLFGLLWEPRPLLPTNACHSAGPLSLFRPGGGAPPYSYFQQASFPLFSLSILASPFQRRGKIFSV